MDTDHSGEADKAPEGGTPGMMILKEKRKEDRRKNYKQAEEWHQKSLRGMVVERRQGIRRKEDFGAQKDFIWYHRANPGANGTRKIILDRVSLILQNGKDKDIIEVRGELSHADHNEIREIFNNLSMKGTQQVVLNLRWLTGIDSAGVGLLVGLYLCLRRRQGELVLTEIPDSIYRLLLNCRLQRILSLESR